MDIQGRVLQILIVDVQIANRLMSHTIRLLGLVYMLLYFPINKVHCNIQR